MIKPSDLPSVPQGNRTAQAAIECYIDEAIRRHHKSSAQWPVVVSATRSGWNQMDIDAVLEQYRAAGWQVMPGGRDSMASLQPATP